MWEVLRSYLPENRKKLWDKSFGKKIFFSFRLDRIVMLLIASSIQELPQMLNKWNLPHSNRYGISWCKTQSFIERKRHFSLIWDVNSHSCFLCQGSDVLILFDVQLQTKPLMKRKKVNIIANKVLMLIYVSEIHKAPKAPNIKVKVFISACETSRSRRYYIHIGALNALPMSSWKLMGTSFRRKLFSTDWKRNHLLLPTITQLKKQFTIFSF